MFAELADIFVNNIGPILLITGVAFVVGRRHNVDPRPVGRIIFYIFSPSLIFYSLSTNEVEFVELARIVLVMFLFVACMMLIGYLIGRWRYPNRVERAGLILSAICPNNGNFGLPLIGFAFNEEVLARAVIVYIAVTFLNYSAGIFVASSGRQSARASLMSIARVPTVYAAAAGVLVNAAGVELPPLVARTVGLTAQAAVPAMIVLLGLQLAQVRDLTGYRVVGTGTGLRLLASPLVALVLIVLFGVQGPAIPAVIMQASMPVAVVTIIFATEYGLDVKLMSGTILTSTLLSPITLTVLILLLRRLGPSPVP